MERRKLYTPRHKCRAYNHFGLDFKCKGFRIGYINIQGLCNKIDQIRILLSWRNNQIQILGLSETKLKNVHTDSFYLN